MSTDPSLRELLAPMAEREVELDGPAFQVDRDQVLARMARASKVSHLPRRAWVAQAVLAAAGIALLVGGARFFVHRSASPSSVLAIAVTEGGATRAAQVEVSGDLATSATSKAQVSTADGLRIELQNRTRVGLGELSASSSQVKLLGGSIRCSVPHRNAAHAFQVVTPDVTVVDLGTVFSVTWDEASHATRVSVEEGEVMVRHAHGQTRVVAPNAWLSSDAASAPSASTPPSAAPVESVTSESAPAPSAPRSPKVIAKTPPATLEQEAQLLRQGLAAERQGHSAEATAAFQQLLGKYPHSPLAPDARAALARVEAASPR